MYWAIAVCLVVAAYWTGEPLRSIPLGLHRLWHLLNTFLSSYCTLNTTYGPDPTVATLVLLLRPLPWRLLLPPPLTISSLTEDAVAARQQHLPALRVNALFRLRDTPLRSIYRMWELTGDVCCAANERALIEETTYFVYQSSWTLNTTPDPHDEDPVRYAFVASLVECLVEVANKRVRFGLRRDRRHNGAEERMETRENPEPFLESVPEWVSKVPGVEKPLWLFPKGVTNVDERFCEPGLSKRNIKRDSFNMHFI